jgi:long-chain acyl-CoA synthetase
VESIVKHARVRELYLREITQRSSSFKGYERVRDFALLTEPFTTDNGLLTPTLKAKRPAVLARYRAVIESMYGGSAD